MQKRPVSISGYLSKMRMGYHILTSDTELRYFTLTGTILRTYKTEKDTAFNPKSELDIMVGLY